MLLLVGKIIIFLICTILHKTAYPLDAQFVVYLLIAFITGFGEVLFESKNIISHPNSTKKSNLNTNTFIPDNKALSSLLLLILTIFFPPLRLYIPITFWNLWDSKSIFGGILFIINLILIGYENPLNETLFIFGGILATSGLCLYLKILTTKTATLEKQLKVMRDSSKEAQLLIEEKNRILLENQDSEIYMATLKERNRIAREIHDNVGHMLTRSILQTGAIKTINKEENLKSLLENLHDTLNTAMTNIRESVHDLHDESINLKTSIEEIVSNTTSPSIEFIYDCSMEVKKEIKYSFISVVKEAINNTEKHSNAKNMTIIIREHPGFFQLLIEDDGKNATPHFENGIGLTNISDRVKALKGHLKISTEKGFKILITVRK